MIFLDVTQSCRSSNNSGIQVVTRNLFGELDKLTKTTPMTWDTRVRKYARLSNSELTTLRKPFQEGYQPRLRPNKEENPFLKELLKSFLRFRRTIPLDRNCSKRDSVVFPEVFRDNRVHYLSGSLQPILHKAGIFYDANVLRDSSSAPAQRTKNFKAYLNFISHCDVVSCISNESEIVFREFCKQADSFPKTKTHSLPAEAPSYRKDIPIEEPPLILFVSTLAYNKNHLCLLDAAERLWDEGIDFKLEFIGQADPSWAPQVERRLKNMVSRNRHAQWLRHVDQATLEERYSACLFTVYPSLFEGCGLPILESLVRGKPCLCGSNGALGEVAKGGGCLTIRDQGDPEVLANGIRQLLEDSTLRGKLIDEAAMRNFGNWQEYASSLLSFFSQK